MRHEVLRTIDEWNGLRREWNDLLTKSRGRSIFMSWQWLDTWLGVHRDIDDLLIIAVRDQRGNLVGVAPHYKVRYTLLRTLPYRVLRVVGDVASGAEYQTWLAASADESAVFAEIVKGLLNLRAEWDLIWLPKLNAWSSTHEPMIATMRASSMTVNTRRTVFSAFSLPGDFDSYLKRMSANRRQQVRRMTKKLLSAPSIEIRKVRAKEEVAPALEALFDLHGKRWRALGQAGVFAREPKEKEFYERFVPQAFEQNWLAMYQFLDNGQCKAVQIGYVFDGVFLQLQEGFDPDYSDHAGNVLRGFVIEDCIKGGLREYDFLGGISEHKRRWSAEERDGIDVLAARPTLKNLPIMKGGVWPTGAYLRPR